MVDYLIQSRFKASNWFYKNKVQTLAFVLSMTKHHIQSLKVAIILMETGYLLRSIIMDNDYYSDLVRMFHLCYFLMLQIIMRR